MVWEVVREIGRVFDTKQRVILNPEKLSRVWINW